MANRPLGDLARRLMEMRRRQQPLVRKPRTPANQRRAAPVPGVFDRASLANVPPGAVGPGPFQRFMEERRRRRPKQSNNPFDLRQRAQELRERAARLYGQ